jgi:hypothetical protein
MPRPVSNQLINFEITKKFEKYFPAMPKNLKEPLKPH